jgi:formylmethanofuran dehydrogenase subunit E
MHFRFLSSIAVFCALVSASSVAQMASTGNTLASTNPLEQVAYIHGMPGPFAVAGYRIGERALKELGVARGTFTLEVVHETPFEVQWSCVADGVQAATGVSVGKLNLKLVEVPQSRTETIVSDRSSGKVVVFRLTPDFIKRFLNLSHEKLADAGRHVLSMPDDEIFSFVVTRANPSS